MPGQIMVAFKHHVVVGAGPNGLSFGAELKFQL
jgi:hypothetical protein